jgi:hypothetical protein
MIETNMTLHFSDRTEVKIEEYSFSDIKIPLEETLSHKDIKLKNLNKGEIVVFNNL